MDLNYVEHCLNGSIFGLTGHEAMNKAEELLNSLFDKNKLVKRTSCYYFNILDKAKYERWVADGDDTYCYESVIVYTVYIDIAAATNRVTGVRAVEYVHPDWMKV